GISCNHHHDQWGRWLFFQTTSLHNFHHIRQVCQAGVHALEQALISDASPVLECSYFLALVQVYSRIKRSLVSPYQDAYSGFRSQSLTRLHVEWEKKIHTAVIFPLYS